MSAGHLRIRQLFEVDAEAYYALRGRLLQTSPDACGAIYAAKINRPVAHTADRLRAQTILRWLVLSACRRGRGHALLGTALERAKRLAEFGSWLLIVTLPNEPARNLYHALGFVPSGIDERGLKLGAQSWDEG